MTQSEFRQKAYGQPVTLLDFPGKGFPVKLTAKPVQHKTGSCGFRVKAAIWVEIGGVPVKHLVSVTMTAVGSKKWAK